MCFSVVARLSCFILLFICISFRLSAESEPNNKFSEANELMLGTPIKAKIQSRGDNDYFKFTVNKPGTITILVDDIPNDFLPELIFYNKDQKYITGVSEKARSLKISEYTCDKGVYYVRFHAKEDRRYSKDEYEISVNITSYDQYECNNTIETATPINLSQEVKAAIQNKEDVDYYALDLGLSGVLDVSLKVVPKNLKIKVELYDPVKQLNIGSFTADSLGAIGNLKSMICREGRYYLRVSDLNKDSYSLDQYILSLSLNKIDFNECNNTLETATKIKIGEVLSGYIDIKGDKDYFSFENPEVGFVVASVGFISNKIHPQLSVYDAKKNLIKEVVGNKGDDKISVEVTTCGKENFYILFNDKNGNAEDQSNPYKISVAHETLEQYECNNTFETATPIIPSVAIRANIRPAGDLDHYRLKLNANQTYQLSVDLVSESLDMVASLFAPEERDPFLKEKRTKGDSILKSFVAPKTGTYYLILEDEGGNDFSTSNYYLLIGEQPTSVNPIGSGNNKPEVFPNPASDYIMVKGIEQNQLVEIVDVTGQTILKTNLHYINISEMSRGVYFIKTEAGYTRFYRY